MSFWPKYCEEYCWGKRFAVPMSCFCDIPLSQIGNHMKWYGSYGLGLAKTWGTNKGVCPVFYVSKNTFSLLNSVIKDENGTNQCKVRKIMTRIKKVKGLNIRKITGSVEKKKKNYLYYNEREWRYVPAMKNFKDLVLLVDEGTEFNEANKKTEDKKYWLKFRYSDIRYIFVKTDM